MHRRCKKIRDTSRGPGLTVRCRALRTWYRLTKWQHAEIQEVVILRPEHPGVALSVCAKCPDLLAN